MFTDQEVGSAGQVFELGAGDINPQLPVQRGKDFAEMYWALVGFFAKPAGRTDCLSAPQTATCQQCTGDIRPVITSGVTVNPGGASEFSPCDDGYFVQ